jgi:hypothetical protein
MVSRLDYADPASFRFAFDHDLATEVSMDANWRQAARVRPRPVRRLGEQLLKTLR